MKWLFNLFRPKPEPQPVTPAQAAAVLAAQAKEAARLKSLPLSARRQWVRADLEWSRDQRRAQA